MNEIDKELVRAGYKTWPIISSEAEDELEFGDVELGPRQCDIDSNHCESCEG